MFFVLFLCSYNDSKKRLYAYYGDLTLWVTWYKKVGLSNWYSHALRIYLKNVYCSIIPEFQWYISFIDNSYLRMFKIEKVRSNNLNHKSNKNYYPNYIYYLYSSLSIYDWTNFPIFKKNSFQNSNEASSSHNFLRYKFQRGSIYTLPPRSNRSMPN